MYLQYRIDTIEMGAFDKLKSLEWLHLTSNRLKHIDGQVFSSILKTIMILDVHGMLLI